MDRYPLWRTNADALAFLCVLVDLAILFFVLPVANLPETQKKRV